MRRPAYFQQVAPRSQPRQSGTMAVLVPPRLLFRPGASTVEFVEPATVTVPVPPATPGPRSNGRYPAPTFNGIRHAAQAARPAPTMTFTPRQASPTPAAPARPGAAAATIPTNSRPPIGPQASTVRPGIPLSSSGPGTPPAGAAATPNAAVTPPRMPPLAATGVTRSAAVAANDPPPPRGRPDTGTAPTGRGLPTMPVIMPSPVAPARTSRAPVPTQPSFHIGTLEVHVVTPVPAQQPPIATSRPRAALSSGPAAGRLGRGFSVFGLGQS